MRRAESLFLLILLLSFAISWHFYPRMPERLASHWNASGKVDGYSSRGVGMFILPGVLAGLTLLFIAIPRIDPRKANIRHFQKYYDRFVVLLMLFMVSIQCQTIAWNLGYQVNPLLMISIGLGVLVYYAGVLCGVAKPNRFVGIRTPWTMSSEGVWEKTHRHGGRLFKAAGALALLGALVPRFAIWLALVPTLSVAVYLVFYSYLEHRREAKS